MKKLQTSNGHTTELLLKLKLLEKQMKEFEATGEQLYHNGNYCSCINLWRDIKNIISNSNMCQ
jgi:hypothetical protein